MVPAFTYKEVCDFLKQKYGQRRGEVKMVGLLFARPDEPFAESQIVPSLPYFHHRFERHFDCFCAGYVFRGNFVLTTSRCPRGHGYSVHQSSLNSEKRLNRCPGGNTAGNPILF
jgi:hypothetical protein